MFVEEHAHGGGACVAVLVGSQGPQKRDEKHEGNGEAEANEHVECAHRAIPVHRAARRVASVVKAMTLTELTGMSRALTSGDKAPLTA